jgi:hypothetical protein
MATTCGISRNQDCPKIGCKEKWVSQIWTLALRCRSGNGFGPFPTSCWSTHPACGADVSAATAQRPAHGRRVKRGRSAPRSRQQVAKAAAGCRSPGRVPGNQACAEIGCEDHGGPKNGGRVFERRVVGSPSPHPPNSDGRVTGACLMKWQFNHWSGNLGHILKPTRTQGVSNRIR